MELVFDEDKMPTPGVIAKMYDAAERCMAYQNLRHDNVEVSVSFVSPEEIKRLNRDFRQNDTVTDVLSFPQYEDPDQIPEGESIALGDVVICEEKAREQAEEFGHSMDRELIYLFVHSIFHLLGYDHMEAPEKAQMREAEESVLGEMGLTRAN
ncbi:MAG: rRNA maturation RNase YbeY [Firmicutes bacterium]|nr:rRNA maturation RNase YbeY [Bacillota bacterium]